MRLAGSAQFSGDLLLFWLPALVDKRCADGIALCQAVEVRLANPQRIAARQAGIVPATARNCSGVMLCLFIGPPVVTGKLRYLLNNQRRLTELYLRPWHFHPGFDLMLNGQLVRLDIRLVFDELRRQNAGVRNLY